MLLAGVLFSFMSLSIRFAVQEVHVLQTVFFRNIVNLLIMLPLFWHIGFEHLRTKRPVIHGLRGLSAVGSQFLWFTGISLIPLATATSLTFTAPLFATLGAALFLPEVVRLRRWIAVFAGFIGTLIILRPGIEAVSVPALMMIGGAVFVATSTLLIKTLSRTEHPDTIVFYLAVVSTPISLVPAMLVWTWPPIETWFWLIMIGVTATAAHQAMTRSFAAADASAVLPYDYSRLIFTSILAFFAFAEIPDIWTWVGGGVIFLSSLYISRREAKAAKTEGLPTTKAATQDST